MFGFRATLENLRDWKPRCQCQSSEQEGSSSHPLHGLWWAASPLVSLSGRYRSWSGCWGGVSNVRLLLSLPSALTEEPWGQCSPHPGCQTNLRPVSPGLPQSTVLLSRCGCVWKHVAHIWWCLYSKQSLESCGCSVWSSRHLLRRHFQLFSPGADNGAACCLRPFFVHLF